ncbi:hypothetical protein [Streptomyces sp. NPDC058451]|uniref:hypothetical protein n=1 Tax=unclassified Streptomyces TaxID=2593676 RepID=UPI003648252D
MRIRATVAAVSGALALSALAVPAAHAAGAPGPAVTFSNVKVNKGKNIVVGATGKVSVPVTYTVTHPASLDPDTFGTGPVLYLGAKITSPADLQGGDDAGTCKAASSTVLNCTATIDIRPARDLVNSEAGAWKVGALAVDEGENATWQGDLGSTKVQRLSKLTTAAKPKPVTKGKTVTVTGKLTRANWDGAKYSGYSGQAVKLQFKKKGTTTYKTLKTVKTDSAGALKTTTKATADGYYRFVFAGNSTTPAVNAAGDLVSVKK